MKKFMLVLITGALLITGCADTARNKDGMRIATYYEECYDGYVVAKRGYGQGGIGFYKMKDNKQIPCDMNIK